MNANPHLRTKAGTIATLMCALLAGLSNQAQADEPFVQWANTYPTGWKGWFVSAVPGSAATLSQKVETNGITVFLRFDLDGRLLASNTIPIASGVGIKTDNTGALYCLGQGGLNPSALSAAKLNPDGTLAWRTDATSPLPGLNTSFGPFAVGADHSTFALAVVQGPFTLGSLTFDDGNGLLLCRIDKDGQVLWARRILNAAGVTGQYSRAGAYYLDIDPSGNVVFCGWLDPGSIDFLGTTVNPGATRTYGWGDGYIAKCDPNGNLIWIHVGNLHLDQDQSGICWMSSAVDRQGNTYFQESQAWLGKLDANGNLLWSKAFANAELWGLTIDAANEPVFGGVISGTVNFDAIPLRAQTSDAQGFFVAKADANGNIRWAIAGGSPASDGGSPLTCDAFGNVLLSASIDAAGSFDGFTLPNRPDPYGHTYVLARLSERPQLRLTNSAGSATVTYPAKATNYVLEAATALPAVSWSAVTNTPTVSGRDRRVQLPLTGPARFFRLRKP